MECSPVFAVAFLSCDRIKVILNMKLKRGCIYENFGYQAVPVILVAIPVWNYYKQVMKIVSVIVDNFDNSKPEAIRRIEELANKSFSFMKLMYVMRKN